MFYKSLSVILIFFIAVLYCFNNNESLITYACCSVKKVEVLIDEFNEKLIKFDDSEFDNFINNLNLQNFNKFIIEDRVIIEGYTDKFNCYTIINNLKINVQISIVNGSCLVGSPLIKNSF